jgi:diketogulonate reductase-like aldo/keto reductase
MTKSYTLNDGSKIPSLAFGTGTALYGKDAADFVRVAIDNNITHLDGAQMYNNEDTLGAGIKASGKSRSELFVVTKLNTLQPGQTIKESLEGSLAKLSLDYVDLFLIHTPAQFRKEKNLSQVWAGMEEVKQAGLAKSIGVSNFNVEDLKTILETAKVVPSVNQIEFHPYVYKAAEPIFKFCQEHGILIESFGGQTPIVRVKGGPIDPVLASIRERLEKAHGGPVSTGQVLSKWILAKNAVVITTTSKQSRIQEFLDTENVPDLTAEEVDAIETAGAKLHKRIYLPHLFDE